MADLPELSPLQREALLTANGRTLHQWKGGFCFSINGNQVSATTADELVAKKLARHDGGGTVLRLTERGREVAQALAEEEAAAVHPDLRAADLPAFHRESGGNGHG